MTYVALLRAINVGGRNAVAMGSLRDCFVQLGFDRVATYIQSGNVIFEANRSRTAELTNRIERALSARFGFTVPVVVLSAPQFRAVIDSSPTGWSHRTDLRRNVAFLRGSLTATQAMRDIEVKRGVDVVTPGKNVLYMSTVMRSLGSSRLRKLVEQKIYSEMTIRSYGTCQRMLARMARS